MSNDAKRAELLALRWRRVFRWYRIRLWGIGPLISAIAAVVLVTFDNEVSDNVALAILICPGIGGTLMSAWSMLLYFRWLPGDTGD
jgi:hypothetical protein